MQNLSFYAFIKLDSKDRQESRERDLEDDMR